MTTADRGILRVARGSNIARINRDGRLWLQYHAGLETLTSDEVRIRNHMAAYRRFPRELFAGSEAAELALLDGGGR